MSQSKHTPELRIVFMEKDKYKAKGEVILDGEIQVCEMIPGQSCSELLSQEERFEYANLFIQAPTLKIQRDRLLEALGNAREKLETAQGEWVSVTVTHAPEWTHPLKGAIEEIESAIAKAEEG